MSKIEVNNVKINNHYHEAIIFKDYGKYVDAINHIEKALEESYSIGDLLITKGILLETLGNPKLAIECFKAASLLQKDNYLVSNYIGSLNYDLKLFKDAAFYYLRSLKTNDKHIYSWVGLGYSELELGDIDKALIAFDEALKIEPKHSNAQLGKIRCNIHRKKYSLAMVMLDSIIREDPKNQEAQVLKAYIKKLPQNIESSNTTLTFIDKHKRDNIDLKVNLNNKWKELMVKL